MCASVLDDYIKKAFENETTLFVVYISVVCALIATSKTIYGCFDFERFYNKNLLETIPLQFITFAL